MFRILVVAYDESPISLLVARITVDVEIGRIRGVLNRGADVDPIRAVRGAGYAFDEQYGMGYDLQNAAKRKKRSTRRVRMEN
jgi:hypothetical protein